MKQELTAAELEARFAQILARPPEQMTEEEARSLAEAEAMDDGTTVTLEELRRELLLADTNRILSAFAEDYRRMADGDTMSEEYNIPELNPRANPYINDGKKQTSLTREEASQSSTPGGGE